MLATTPIPSLQRTAGLRPSAAELTIRSASMRSFEVAGALLLLFSAGCGMGWNAYADEPLRRRISSLEVDQVVEAVIEAEICPRQPLALAEETLVSLVSRIGKLAPAPDIGNREPWKMLRLITLRTRKGETFEIEIATRKSLGSLPIVILQEKPNGGLGFYYGDTVWQWLKGTPESTELAAKFENEQPCL